MAKLPFMKFYPSDFLIDVQTLSLEEIGAWMKLVCYIWIQSKDGRVSLSNREIANFFGVDVDESNKILMRLADRCIFDHKRTLLEGADQDDPDENEVINHIVSRRIRRDKKLLSMNAFYVSKHRSKVAGKENVKDKKSEVRSQKTDKDSIGVPPNPASLKTPKELNSIQKVVTAFKIVSGYQKEDPAWDKINFARCSKSAKSLLDFLGSWEGAVDCVQDVYEKFNAKGLTVTLETVVKHASDWKKDRQERRPLNGVLSVPSYGSR